MISIVMATYNSEVYISEAIKSLLNQSFSDFELIIINDGSTDITQSLLDKIKDRRVRVYNNVINRGLIYSLNFGFSVSKGKYIARMDADDISLPYRLEKQWLFMESNPDIHISGGQMEFIGNAKGKVTYPLTHAECLVYLLDQPCFSNNNFIIRRNTYETKEFSFNTNYKHAEDYKFYTDVLLKTKGANINDVLTYYRKHDNSVSNLNFKTACSNRNKIRIEYIQRLIDVKFSKAECFYGNIGLKKLIAFKEVRKLLRSKFSSELSPFIDDIIINRIWYIDALYESEKSIFVFFKFPVIFSLKFNRNIISKWLNILKHYITYNIK